MKRLLTAITLFTAITTTAQARHHHHDDGDDHDHGSLWTCSLNFTGEGKGFQILFGRFTVTGTGTLRCVDVHGERKDIPVKMRMGGRRPAWRVGMGKMKIAGRTREFGLLQKQPEDFLGIYRVAHAQGAAGVGAGVLTAVHKGDSSLSMDITVEFLGGLGFNVGFSKLTMERDDTPRT